MLRDVRLGVVVPFACALLATSGCQSRDLPSRDSSSGPSSATLPPAPQVRSDVSSTSDVPVACATLREVSTSDAVRVEGSTLFYAESGTGLTLVDISDPAKPRRMANVPFVGMPRALFVREGIAWVVFTDFDARFTTADEAATVVRAVDVTHPDAPVVVGDEVRIGHPRDAKLVGGVLYTLAATKTGSMVESFSVRRGKLDWRDKVALDGAPAQLAASSAGLAVVTTFDAESRVTWLDLPLETPGTLVLRETLHTPGGVAVWDRGDGRVVDADDGQRVRLVTCATRSCGPEDAATLRILDFGGSASPRLSASLRLTERGGLPLTRFSNEMLFVGEASSTTPDTTMLRIVRTDEPRPRLAASMALRGLVSGFVARDASLVALGTTGRTEGQSRIVLHDLDVRRPDAPRLRGSASFGSDWTWSPALDDEKALSFDPASHLVAVPFTAWRYADKRYVTGTQLVDLSRHGAQNLDTLPSEGFVERAVFVDGQLVTIGPDGVHAVDYGAARRGNMAERTLDLGGAGSPTQAR